MPLPRLYGATHFTYDPISEAVIVVPVGGNGVDPASPANPALTGVIGEDGLSQTSSINPLPVLYGDTAQLDAFGRLRVSSPFGIFDSKQIGTNDPYAFEEKLVGTATNTYQYDRSSTYLTIGTASGDRAVRQTVRYFSYVPGKGQSIVCTGVLGAGKANVTKYIGYGDDRNGLFFCQQGATLGILTRTNVTATTVDTFVAQSSWNKDKMDGTGPSRITLDVTKAQIFMIDFQWLGVGRVRFSIDIDGRQYVVHEINNANNQASVYMTTPTLPVRYEIVNTGTSASSTTLEQICISVASEGGYAVPGIEFTSGNGITRVGVTTRRPIFAIRLKSAFPVGKPNRRTVKFVDFAGSAITNNAYLELVHIHGPTSITATWADVDDSSGVEYSVDISAITAAHSHVVQSLDVFAGTAGKGGGDSVSGSVINTHSYLSQNFDSTNSEVFVVYATAESGTANCSAHITFVEIG